MMISTLVIAFLHSIAIAAPIDQTAMPRSSDQSQERTVFQTGSSYSDRINLRADVAIVYGFDPSMPARVKAWRDRGYRVHLMTGVAWGQYQDYYYGRWDGINHEDEAQTRKSGEKVGHGGDVYYMSPGSNYGNYLADGVKRALDVGVEAVHLEEPEFWTFGGYGEGFKREWAQFYHEAWQDPESSPDARWRAAKLMYFLYRRALQQVFDSIQGYNKAHGTQVRCYVPTHSLLNYSQWNIVSPESSLARLNGCDGYIAQVWTGTARTPNVYRGVKRERTFETAFLEYGAMQNLVGSTGRGVWYLADPVEDDPNHDWGDYRRNWESTLAASLLQPDVSQYEVMPWPERIFNGTYPSERDRSKRIPIPPSYATELQVVINALKDMKQNAVRWDKSARGVGVMISDSLMFQRGGPFESDGDLSHVYGLALPFVKRGIAVQPVQLENVNLPGYLDGLKVILMTYEGMKPLTPVVHDAIAKWVQAGGVLVFVDSDTDPYAKVREWWNQNGLSYATPREHLFEQFDLPRKPTQESNQVGKGVVVYLRRSPTSIAHDPAGSTWLAEKVKANIGRLRWDESSSLVLRRGPYVVAAGLDESDSAPGAIRGRFVDLFDQDLKCVDLVAVQPGSRHLLIDLDKFKGQVIAASGSITQAHSDARSWSGLIEGIANTPGVIMLKIRARPQTASIDGQDLAIAQYDSNRHIVWLRFPMRANPQKVTVTY